VAIEAVKIDISGKAISGVIQLAELLTEDPSGDPRGVLVAAVAAATLIAADLPVQQGTLAPLAALISKVAAEEAEKLSIALEASDNAA
jgi:hypothetical protein